MTDIIMDQEKISFRCKITPSNPAVPLTMRVWLDEQVIWGPRHIDQVTDFECWVDDTEQQHQLQFEMQGKTQEHTEINDAGEIVKDAHLTLDQFAVDDIDLPDLKTFEYRHDFNGTKDPVTDKFYGYMGCNGTVSVKFTTPIYLWLLENM